MRRLSEILSLPKAWYRRNLARRLFLGDDSMTRAGGEGKWFLIPSSSICFCLFCVFFCFVYVFQCVWIFFIHMSKMWICVVSRVWPANLLAGQPYSQMSVLHGKNSSIGHYAHTHFSTRFFHTCHAYRLWIQIRRMRFTTQWRAAFRVKSFKAVVIRGKFSGGGGGWLEIRDRWWRSHVAGL